MSNISTSSNLVASTPEKITQKIGYKRLLKYLSLIPGIAALASVTLYILGFLVVFSYMAGFGFISYSIVNIKFIVAGLWALMGYAFAYYCFRFGFAFLNPIFEEENGLKKFFNAPKKLRIPCYISFFAVPYVTASVFKVFVTTLGGFPFTKTPKLSFSSLFGKYDFIGNIINHYLPSSSTNPGFIFVIAYVIYFSIYIFILITPYKVYRLFKPKKEKPEKINNNQIEKQETKKDPDEKRTFRGFWDIYIDILGILIILIILLYAFNKLLAERITILNFHLSPIGYGTLQVWIMEIVILFILFKQLGWTKDWKKSMKNLDSVDALFRTFLVPLIATIISFGQVIYPRISYSIGGGSPRQIVLNEYSGLSIDPEKDKLYLIDETSEYYFLVVQTPEKNKAIQLKKGGIGWMEVINSQTSSTNNHSSE